MKVFKFGGGIIKNAESVRRLSEVIKLFPIDQLIIVISALGKTTNALEDLVELYFEGKPTEQCFNNIRYYHLKIIENLFKGSNHKAFPDAEELFAELQSKLDRPPVANYDFEYDQLICYGELLSSSIVHHHLIDAGIINTLVDVRRMVRTDSRYREAEVDWATTHDQVIKELKQFNQSSQMPGSVVITQGFIGSDSQGYSTSLGREGSDYSAAIFANILDATEVIIWKDVAGVLNADPKQFDETVKLEEVSYTEAMELAYYGAKIIHPKTIKPLQNKGIPLQVKSFYDPSAPGTMIWEKAEQDGIIPSFIKKPQQTLISLTTKDYSFISENNLGVVFRLIMKYSIGLNLMQNSAVSLSLCFDRCRNLSAFLEELKAHYFLKYNEDLELITIRHYTSEAIDKAVAGKEILVEQRSRITVQFVVR